MKNLAGFSRGQSCFLVEHTWGICWALVIFIIICACCLGRADSDDIYYLADRDQSLDRVVGSGVAIGASSYFSRGVSVSTGPESLGSVTVVATVNPNAITLEVSFETKGKGKAFIVKNDISDKTGETLGDTHDLFCTKPKVFYLYPASEYLNSEGQLEISVGAQEGDTLDVNYVRVRALDYRPLSTRQATRVVYDYPPTYSQTAPSIWFAIYRGPYYDYSAGYCNNYYGWWDRPDYYAWYHPYYQRVIVPVYNQYNNYFFYNERHRQWRGGHGSGYGGDHYRDSDRGGGSRLSDRVRYNNDNGGGREYRSSDRVGKGEVKSAGYLAPKEKSRSNGSALDIRRGAGTTRQNRAYQEAVQMKQNPNRRTEQQGGRIQPKPDQQRLTGLTLDKNGDTPDVRVNNPRANPGEKVRREEPRQQPRQPAQQRQIQREQPVRAIQPERVNQQQSRPEQKRMPEPRVEPRSQPQQRVESRAPAPPKDDEDKNKNQQKHRR